MHQMKVDVHAPVKDKLCNDIDAAEKLSEDEEIDEWLLPVAAARLMEWISESEKDKLLGMVKRELKKVNS